MALQRQNWTTEPPKALRSPYSELNYAGNDEGRIYWSDEPAVEPVVARPHPHNAQNPKQRPKIREGSRMNVNSHRCRTGSLNPPASEYPYASNNILASGNPFRTLDGRGQHSRPSGEIIENRYGYFFNDPSYPPRPPARPPARPPGLYGQPTPVPRPVDPLNHFPPHTGSHHAPDRYDTYYYRPYAEGDPFAEVKERPDLGSRQYHEAGRLSQPSYPLSGQYDRWHKQDSRPSCPKFEPYQPYMGTPGLQQQSAEPPPSPEQTELERVRTELQKTRRSLRREKGDRERAEKEAAERKKKAAEGRREAAERKREAAELERRYVELGKMLQEINFGPDMREPNRDLEAEKTSRDPARTRMIQSDYDQRDLPLDARQTGIVLPLERNAKLDPRKEQFLDVVEGRMQHKGRYSSGELHKRDVLGRLVGQSTHEQKVASRPRPRLLHGAIDDAISRKEVEEAVLGLLHLLLSLYRGFPLAAEQEEDFDGYSTSRVPQSPRDYPAAAANIRHELSMFRDRREQGNALPLRNSGSMQTLQDPKGSGKDSKLASNDQWDKHPSQEAAREPMESGYGSMATRSTMRSENGQHSSANIVREGKSMQAQDMHGSTQSEVKHQYRGDRKLSRYQAPRVSSLSDESYEYDESDGPDMVPKGKRATYAGRPAPDPPRPVKAELGPAVDRSIRHRHRRLVDSAG